ncbi:hypothetical protein [Flaviaesturariibacter terrae]
MKKTIAFSLLLAVAFASCKKSGNAAVTLSADATQVSVGQEVTVTVNNGNASRWTVTPAATATQVSSSATQSKFSFSADGTYSIGVRTGDSTGRHSCQNNIDSASVKIVVGSGS